MEKQMPITTIQMQDEPPETSEEKKAFNDFVMRLFARNEETAKWSTILAARKTNIIEEMAAIATIQESDPTDIQAISGSKLTLSNSFYNNALLQSQQSFLWSLI